MNKPLKSVSDDALQLSAEDRLRLVDRLLESIEPGSPSLDQVWSQEIAERVRAFDLGETDAFDSNDVFAEARWALIV